MIDDPTYETFKPHEGTKFTVLIGNDRFDLSLDAVRLDTPHENQPRAEPFTLLFSGPAGIEQGTHEMQHEALGDLAIFIVPIDAGTYEAIFN